VIKGGGVMVLGQEQDSLGGSFSPEEAFTGDLSQLNVWNKVLSPHEIYNLVRNCFTEAGNVKAWADFQTGLQGVYVLTNKSHACNCEFCFCSYCCFLVLGKFTKPTKDQGFK